MARARASMSLTVIIGLGNPLMSDEGVGIHVLRALAERAGDLPGADLVDAGTSAMAALHAMAHRRRAIFVDCAFMGAEPGAVRRFTPSQVSSRKELAGFSLHEGDLLDAIELSRQLGECPEQVVIFGIQPERVAPGETLSAVLRDRLAEYVKLVQAEALQ
jgi:hydrogenase maturation protease